MKKVVAFDFDGTITSNDTLFQLLKFSHGRVFYFNFLVLIPVLLAFKLKLLNNSRAKEIVFSFFFKGWPIDKFNSVCVNFAKTIKTRKEAIKRIKIHLENDDEVIIISASLENWVLPWAESHDIDFVLATKIEVRNDRVTGRFLSKNCYGIEKKNRLLQSFPKRYEYYLIAYGDSIGDFELLEFADESYFKLF